MEEAEEKYSDKIIKGIISGVELDKEVGYINTMPSIETPKGILIRGYCNTKPNLINKTDKRLWVEHWNLTGEFSNISYSLSDRTEVFPTLFMREIDKVDYSEVVSSVKLMDVLLRGHYKATLKYDNEIAQPFIKERSKLIEEIVEV